MSSFLHDSVCAGTCDCTYFARTFQTNEQFFLSLLNLEYLCQQQTNQHSLLIGTRLLLEYYDVITGKFDRKILIYIVVTRFVEVIENLESHGIQAFHFPRLESHGI